MSVTAQPDEFVRDAVVDRELNISAIQRGAGTAVQPWPSSVGLRAYAGT